MIVMLVLPSSAATIGTGADAKEKPLVKFVHLVQAKSLHYPQPPTQLLKPWLSAKFVKHPSQD